MKNTIIQLNAKANVRFIKEVIERPILSNGEEKIKESVVILLKNLDNNRCVIHPLTSFLLQWDNCELNTILKVANEIVPFLNYILIDNCDSYELNSLWDITFEHGSDYLNVLGETRSRSTVKSTERTLTKFYFFLTKKKLLKTIVLEDFTFTKKTNGSGHKTESISSPFEGVIYPDAELKNILHHLPNELVLPFLNTALYKVPRIALGVYLQMFGGLRIGEVVNISKGNITLKGPYGQNGMVVRVQKQPLRPDLKNNDGKGGVKTPRYQTIFSCFGLLSKLYKYHLDRFDVDGEVALFVNSDGNALTERSYRGDFEKLKEEFISTLEKSDDLKLRGYGISLRQKKWSTHIGRGVFSNLVSDVADTAVEIALARGDKSLDSALSYTSDAEKLAKKVESNLNKMHIAMIENSIGD